MISNDFESLNYETYLKVRKPFQHSQPSFSVRVLTMAPVFVDSGWRTVDRRPQGRLTNCIYAAVKLPPRNWNAFNLKANNARENCENCAQIQSLFKRIQLEWFKRAGDALSATVVEQTLKSNWLSGCLISVEMILNAGSCSTLGTAVGRL